MGDKGETIPCTRIRREVLANRVFNRDAKMALKFDKLFTKMDQRKNLVPPPKGPERFDMGYDDTLINKINNEDVREMDFEELFIKKLPEVKKVKEIRRYKKNPEVKEAPPFDLQYEEMGYDDILINIVNNEDPPGVINEGILQDLLTNVGPRKDFLIGKAAKPKLPTDKKEIIPSGYAMSPHNPPPFRIERRDVLLNKAFNKEPKIVLKLDDLLTKIGPRADFLKKKCKKSIIEKTPPPFDMGLDDVLINKANNEDPLGVIKQEDLQDLFPNIGPRKDFLIGKAAKPKLPTDKKEIIPSGYAMSPHNPPPFRIESEHVLLNEAFNGDPKIELKLDGLLTKIGRRVDYLKNKCKKPIIGKTPPPFDMGFNDVLMNCANNREPSIDYDVCELLLPIVRTPTVKLQKCKKKKGIPRGCAMNPDCSPPPHDKGSDDVHINQANNTDVRINVKLIDLFTKIGQRTDFLKAKKKQAANMT